MTPDQAAAASGNAAWRLISASLVLLMTPALAMFYGGMSRQKSVLNMMLMSFGAAAVVSIVYVLWGWSMSYGSQSMGGFFANPFEFCGLKDSIFDSQGNYIEGANGYANIIDVGFQLTFAVISAALISGALAERVKFGTWLAFAALWVTFVYFPLAHMVWGGGFLSHSASGLSAALFGTAGEEAAVAPIDFAGGTVVHISAGTAALVLALIVGKRDNFMKSPHRPHNVPFVMLGSALLWFGWFGWTGMDQHDCRNRGCDARMARLRKSHGRAADVTRCGLWCCGGSRDNHSGGGRHDTSDIDHSGLHRRSAGSLGRGLEVQVRIRRFARCRRCALGSRAVGNSGRRTACD